MCDSSGFSASEGYCTCITPDLTHADFVNAPAFHIFKDQLRRAVRCLTVAELSAFRRCFEDVWQEVLEEL